MYFPGDPLLEYDPIFQSTADQAARERLICAYDPRSANRNGRSATASTWSCAAAPRPRRTRADPMATMTDKLIPTPSQTVGPFFHLGMDAAGMGRSDGRQQSRTGRAHRDRGKGARWRRRAGAGRGDRGVAGERRRALQPPGRPARRRRAARSGVPRLRPGRHRTPTADSVWSRSSPARCRDAAMRGRRRISMSHCSRAACCATSIRGSISPTTRATKPTRCCRRSTTQRCAARCWPARRKGEPPVYRFDIVLQGENETAFLDI